MVEFPEYDAICPSEVSQSSGNTSISKKKRGSTMQNHSEIEKRRRDKMNTYILELSSIIPVGTSRKLDKLTVLRMAVQHMKFLRGSLNSYTEGHYKPAFLSDDELKNLILQVADGFLFVVGTDGGKILYVSESVSQTLQYTHSQLLGTSWFDILHPKDLAKVKEQLSSTDINRRDRLVDAKTLLPVKNDMPLGLSRLCPGLRRSFFCRMRCKSAHAIKEEADTTTGQHKKKNKPHSSDKKYSIIHFTGYLKSWSPSKHSVDEDTESDSESCNLSCLVAVGRVHENLLGALTNDSAPLQNLGLQNQTFEYVSKHTNEGKFVFIDQKASLLLGWLPQELLGTSVYEFFHPDDIPMLAETHRLLLQANESLQTPVYRFRTKDASFLHLRSSWKTFKNPWTKDIEYIIACNSLVLLNGEAESSVVSGCVSSQSYENLSQFINSPGCTSSSSLSPSRMVGSCMQASKIGRKIAEEVLETQRRSDSPESTLDAILGSSSEKSFNSILKADEAGGSRSDIGVAKLETSLEPEAINENNFQFPSQSDLAGNNSNIQLQISNTPDLLDVVSCPDLETETPNNTDETTMAVIMSLLDADAELEPVDFSRLPWPLP